MSGRFVVGLLLLVTVMALLYAGVRAWRMRVFPDARGPSGVVRDIVLTVACVVVVCELLGSVGLYRLPPVAFTFAALGAAMWFLASRATERPHALPPAPPGPVVDPALAGRWLIPAVVAVALVVGSWAAQAAYSLHYGIYSIDSIWYHLPVAARFVQEGSITGVHYLDRDALTPFFPATTPLLHGLGIMFLRSDILTPVFNLGVLAFALTVGWCMGRPFGVAPSTMVAVAAVFATPIFVSTQPGGAYNDIFGVAMLLAAVAILVESNAVLRSPRSSELALAGLAAGIALGTKWQFIAPVAALTIAVLVLAVRDRRLRPSLAFVAGMTITGSFFYVRNLVVVGNPIPAFEGSIGPFELPHVPVRIPEDALIEFLFDASAWRDYFIPGLNDAFGPLWWMLLTLVGVGIVLSVISPRSRQHRLAAVVGAAALVAYVVVPQALRVGPVLFFFEFNLRYAATGLVLGAVALPLLPAFRGGRARWVLMGFALVVLMTQLDPTIWPTDLRSGRFSEPVRGTASVIGALVGVGVLGVGLVVVAASRRGWSWRPSRGMAASACVVAIAAAAVANEYYLDHRYTHDVDEYNLSAAYRWARDVSDERIAVVGNWLHYPLYGNDLSNHVQYVADHKSDHTNAPIANCADWRRELNEGRYTYVVTGPSPIGEEVPVEQRWTESDPAARREWQDGFVTLFRVIGTFDPDSCAGAEQP